MTDEELKASLGILEWLRKENFSYKILKFGLFEGLQGEIANGLHKKGYINVADELPTLFTISDKMKEKFLK